MVVFSQCKCKHGGGGSLGRVQWDPARDLWTSEGREPRKITRQKAIQIGLKGRLNKLYVESILSIDDATLLCHRVHDAHSRKSVEVKEEMEKIKSDLPIERTYLPKCSPVNLMKLKLLPMESL